MLPAVLARTLAFAFVDKPWQLDNLVERARLALGKRPRWLRGLAARVLSAFGPELPARPALVAKFIRRDEVFSWVCRNAPRPRKKLGRLLARVPAPGRPESWPVPELATREELARWLELSFGELEWFADTKALERHAPAGPLRHYHYRWKVKRAGEQRLLEAPKQRLKSIQRRLLSGLLDRIPPHEAAHGFRVHRSIKTFAAPHVGQRIVLKLDLADFFPSIRHAQIVALFRTLGYSESVVLSLAGLCTNSAPSDAWDGAPRGWTREARWKSEALYLRPHLPQGAPTSPALANLCAFGLDCRLAGLAGSASATYTRYADDLAFSGGHNFERNAARFYRHVCAIVLEEGFSVNYRKTRFMRRAMRQRLAGVVVNEKTNITRADFDDLKAILHNCLLHGPVSQNRDQIADFRAHLAGRVSHVALLNPARGEKLRQMLDRIAWEKAVE